MGIHATSTTAALDGVCGSSRPPSEWSMVRPFDQWPVGMMLPSRWSRRRVVLHSKAPMYVPARPEESSTRSATDELRPQRLTARQRHSALRSATHHRLMRLRVLRVHRLAVRFLVRLSRLSAHSGYLRVAQRAVAWQAAPLSLSRRAARPSAPHDPKLL